MFTVLFLEQMGFIHLLLAVVLLLNNCCFENKFCCAIEQVFPILFFASLAFINSHPSKAPYAIGPIKEAFNALLFDRLF